jgi:hypothetical protein
MKRQAARALCTLLAALALSGCGYQQSGKYTGTGDPDTEHGYRWQSLYRQDVQTVAVPIFTNKSFNRGSEFKLSRAVVQQIEARTPYKVVDRSQADTILEGEISQVRTNTVSLDPRTVLPQEQLLTVTVNFTWKDLRTGRVLCQRKAFEQSVTFYPSLGESTTIGTENATDRLAIGIVQELQADW